MHTTLILGGYGFFGQRICRALHADANIKLLIAGRNLAQARALANELHLPPEQAVALDARSSDLAQQLAALKVNTIVHTAGPFQGQDYAVAKAAIAAGANYIDLADGRDFVANIRELDAAARERDVLVVSGASSLPALSSAVVDRYLSRFSQLESIRSGIGSGARSPGVATMRGVFAYCGKPFLRLSEGEWSKTYGWLDLQRYAFPAPVGNRLLGSCDVPDLALFPQRYPGVRSVSFHAGFASNLGHLAVWFGAQLVRIGLLPSLVPLVAPLHRISLWMEPLISDTGDMFVAMEGKDLEGKPLKLVWHLVAKQNHGPQIPCGASISLARKLARGTNFPSGAMPCMGLLTVEDYLAELREFDVTEIHA